MQRKLLVGLSLLGSLIMCSSADAAITQVFSNTPTPVSCVDAPAGTTAGQRWCSGTGLANLGAASTVASFDGTPIDVAVTIPPSNGTDNNYPAVGVFHGYGQSKRIPSDSTNVQRWVTRGYVVFSMSIRGFGNSCGAGVPSPKPANCSKGFIHLLSNKFEVRDAQYLLGKLADEGIIDNTKIGATGISYGGGLAMQLGALKNRVQQGALSGETNGALVPWKSTGGKDMAVKAVVPEFGWSNLGYGLVPNGSTLDYAALNPYLGPNNDKRVGVEKLGWTSGLYQTGLATGYVQPTGATGDDANYDLQAQKAQLDTGGPYDNNTVVKNAVSEFSTYHSAYGIDDSVAPAPTFLAQGYNDDLFPVDEALRYYNKVRENHADTPIYLYAFDYGHTPRAAINTLNVAGVLDSEGNWMDYYVRGTGDQPTNALGGVSSIRSACDASNAPIGSPIVRVKNWASFPQGEITLTGTAAKTIAASTAENDAFQTFTAPQTTFCTTGGNVVTPGAAVYELDAQASDYTIAGSPTINMDLTSAANDQVVARLYDVSVADNNVRLIGRAAARFAAGTAAKQVLQLHPQHTLIAAGHKLRLELLSTDTPYVNATPGQAAMTVANVSLRIPTRDAAGALAGTVKVPAAPVVPAGYKLARDLRGPDPTPTATPTATATAPYTVPTPTATATAPPTYVVKKRPGLSGKVRPKRDKKKPFKFTVSGSLKRPSGVSKSAGCKGKIKITVKKGSKTVGKGSTKVKSSCKYSKKIKLNKKAGKKGKAKFSISFRGNSRLLTKTIKKTAKYGKK